jgi:hypothetical protein
MHGDRADQRHRNAAVDIYINDDQSECIVVDRHRDSEALIEHSAHIGGDQRRQSLRRDRSPARSLVSRARSSERRRHIVRSPVSLRLSCRCRYRSPAWARLPRAVAAFGSSKLLPPRAGPRSTTPAERPRQPLWRGETASGQRRTAKWGDRPTPPTVWTVWYAMATRSAWVPGPPPRKSKVLDRRSLSIENAVA